MYFLSTFEDCSARSEKALVEELRIGMDDPENAVMNVSFIGGSVVGSN